MNMDGEQLVVGDGVYDVIFLNGKVDRILEQENKFWVKFATRSQCYDDKGNGNFGLRTLYWHDPVLTPPSKNEAAWDKTGQIAKAVSKILGGK